MLGKENKGCIQRGSEDVFEKERDWERRERERCGGMIFFCLFISNACGGCETTETVSTEGWNNALF